MSLTPCSLQYRTENEEANVTAAQPQRGVSKRAVFVGLLCATAISCGESYGTLVVRGSAMAADYSTGAAIFLFFLLTLLLNPLAHLLTGSRLHSGELATIYIMMIVASAIPSWGFVMNLIPFLGGLFYFATPENDWANIIHPHIKPWLVSQDRAATWKLFEGAARGEPMPWGLWHKPMLAWGFFILSVYFVTLCMLVILRKQWMEHERLLFPLSVLPLELAQGEQGRRLPPLLRNYLTWVGFLLPFLINLVNGLHSYFNYFPFIQLNTPLRFLRESVRLNLYPRFEVIGLSYLLSLDVSFGVWFFAFLAYVHTGVERLFGWSIGPSQPYSMPASASVAHLAQGAMFFLVFSSLWAARQHIGDVLRKAFKRDPAIDDSGEMLSYRTAVLSFLKARFVGFPIHPIGLVLGLTYPISQIWFSVFIAWAFKAVILKYGGARGYRLLRPLFLGMVLGAFGSAGMWLIIDYFGGMSNRFTM